jgi:thiol-disulfide isomerase/thioredoxin
MFKTVTAVCLSLICSFLSIATAQADVTVGQPAPNVSGKLIDGQPYSLSASKGKVVLINFWASWCEPCTEEMPMIEEFLQKNKANGFEVLSVNIDKPSGLDAAKQIMKKYSFQFALKNDLQYSALGYIWRVPSTFIIDKEGIVRKNGLTGEPKVNTKILEESIAPLLRAH